MKRSTFSLFLFVVLFYFVSPVISLADEGRLEKWPEEKKAGVKRAEKVAKPPAKVGNGKKWRIFGKVGYSFDDNVRLQSDKTFFGKNTKDQSAGRYTLAPGFAYNVYKDKKYKADIYYEYSLSVHDDNLEEFNFTNHRVGVVGARRLTLWNRPSNISARYTFDHGTLEHDSHSSSNSVTLSWAGSWAKNWRLSVYESLSFKNFRNKGFRPSDTSRDGFYHRTGFLQRYFFKAFDRRNEINFGYEFGFSATEGNRFDRVTNGVRVGFNTLLIEKIRFETNLYFQDRYFHHFPDGGDSHLPPRHDLHWKHEYILSREIGKNLNLEIFYGHTDANNKNDGVLGVFNYRRNIYGVELKFSY